MSILNTTLIRDIEPGIYTTRVKSFKEVNIEGRQPYIAVNMTIDNLDVVDKWYSSRIPYIMRCLRHQFHKDYMDCTLSELLQIANETTFVVTVSYDPKYGRQIDYREEVSF